MTFFALEKIITNIQLRYLNIQLSNESNMTTGKIYKLVIVRISRISVTFNGAHQVS